MRNGKGSEPRNVGPNFQTNFTRIKWDGSNGSKRFRRTSTRRIYTYGKVHRAEIEFSLVPDTGCPNPDCSDGTVDTGGVTPWGSPILDKCNCCNGTDILKPKIPWPGPKDND